MDAAGRGRVKLNVGGRVFETNLGTLKAGGEKSLLASSAEAAVATGDIELFFDSDPDVFAVLLNVLRTGKFRSDSKQGRQELIEEANFLGISDALRSAMAPSEPLNGIDVERVGSVVANGRDFPSAIASAEDGSLWVAHGSKVTVFDWALQKRGTTLTEFNSIDSLCRISDTCVAAGSRSLSGLHLYDVLHRRHVKSLVWSDKNDPRIYSTTVQAISCSDNAVFASSLSGHKMDNTILIVDKNRLEIVQELARQSGTSAGYSKHATKLQWVPGLQVLAASGVHGGAFGYSSYLRLYDVRSERLVLDWSEPNVRNPRAVQRDSFADVAVSEELSGIVKVSVVTGALSIADLRKADGENIEWTRLVERDDHADGPPEQENMTDLARLLCYNRQVFCSRGKDVEVWQELKVVKPSPELEEVEDVDLENGSKDWFSEDSFRRNFIEHSRRHSSGYNVRQMEAGGNRLFIAREELQGVEVWESS